MPPETPRLARQAVMFGTAKLAAQPGKPPVG